MTQINPLVVETHGLSKRYRGVMALKSLDLKVPKHSIFAFLGPNGAGKTTALKLLLGLARPTSGNGLILQQDIVRESPNIRRQIGYLPQEPRFYENMTARETLRFVSRFFYTGPRRQIETRIEDMLDLVGLSDRPDRPVRGFSGGERQRLGIAQAQINEPELLILDEPAAALDPMGRHDVLAIMERLRLHTTIFYSTHILDDVQRVSDTVAILKDGELVAQAPIATLLSGYDGLVYTVSLRGDAESVRPDILAQAWVLSIQASMENGITHWRVAVTNEAEAETNLLPLLLGHSQITVAQFGREKTDLESVFINLVAGGRHD